jgi:NADH-quinone oxidoreductase subunit C
VSLEDLPGLVELREAYGETTAVVETAALLDACVVLRDEHGFNFLADIAAADYLDYGARGVSGYIATAAGRDLNTPMTQGLQVLPDAKPKRFSVSYHLLAVCADPRRLRLQVWVDDGEPVASVITVWPTTDWHEREAFDLMGIAIEGHPNLRRILTDDDWEGHPLRKDYPIGGEPVRFSEAE